MTEINWASFKSKFYGKERAVFERLAYLLFCHEFNKKIGIFRYKNQTGIETEPISLEGKCVGFQTKYFDDKIGKDDIISSLIKAKGKNPKLGRVLLYVNKEFSESSNKGKKKPTNQKEIEAAATNLSLELEWRLPNSIEVQLSAPENKHLAEYFFSLDAGATDFLDKMKAHSENILGAIHTSIRFNSHEIKIDKSNSLSQINVSKSQIIIVSEDGGSGKTALIKDGIFDKEVPCYVLRAAEFARPSLTEVFRQLGAYDIADFIRFHEGENKKVFVIDSAEKLADFNREVFIEFLTALIRDRWTIIFTTRNSYLDDLRFQMEDVYRSPFDVIRIENLSIDELEYLSTTFGFQLPADARLQRLICNLFYLREYLISYSAIDKQVDVTAFRAILWQKKIVASQFRKEGINIYREKCFLKLAKDRCISGNFFLNGDECDSSVLAKLVADEVLGYDAGQSGYFITHDIYEEWALERLIENEFALGVSYEIFFANIGNSLPMRRAFRSWLSDKLHQVEVHTRHFVSHVFNNDNIPAFWQDELLISVLLSDYCAAFFQSLDKELLDNDKALLKRLIFLLRIACKEVDNEFNKLVGKAGETSEEQEYLFTKPKGKGWEVVIEYLYRNTSAVSKDELPAILPLLYDWCSRRRIGDTAKAAGLFALHFYKDAEINDKVYYEDDIEKSLLQIVLFAAAEIKDELIEITEGLLSPRNDRRQPFDSLREAILKDSDSSFTYITTFPEMTMRLAESSWYWTGKRRNLGYMRGDIEEYYSIRRSWHHDYFPASALQTPVYLLMLFKLYPTIDFILDFTNRSVEDYYRSGDDTSAHEVEVVIGAERTKQIAGSSLWEMYRGGSNTPNLLQSVHMALEKRLLELAKNSDKRKFQDLLIYLLSKTHSASISAVVASIVLANPEELFDVAKVLFSNWEFFRYDNLRASSEIHARATYTMGYGLNWLNKRFEDERIAAGNAPHRQMSLENLAVNYQFIKGKKLSEEEFDTRRKTLLDIVDGFYEQVSDCSDDEQSTLRLQIARLDSRKITPEVTKMEDRLRIEFKPELEPDLQERSQATLQNFHERYRYVTLKHWAVDKLENTNRYGPYKPEYEKPELILNEVKELIEELETGDEAFFLYNSNIPVFVCAALVKCFSAELSDNDLHFCSEWIIDSAVAPLRDNYHYQFADGVEAAIGALPFLYPVFKDERQGFNKILLLILFDTYPLNNTKRLCDYAIDSLHTLFSISPDDANKVLYGYMALRAKFDQENPRQKRRMEQRPRIGVLKEFG